MKILALLVVLLALMGCAIEAQKVEICQRICAVNDGMKEISPDYCYCINGAKFRSVTVMPADN